MRIAQISPSVKWMKRRTSGVDVVVYKSVKFQRLSEAPAAALAPQPPIRQERQPRCTTHSRASSIAVQARGIAAVIGQVAG
jgi:hypothetical protein